MDKRNSTGVNDFYKLSAIKTNTGNCDYPEVDSFLTQEEINLHCKTIVIDNTLICFSGHIHEAQGMETIGETKVINPGPLREGKYAYARINTQIEKIEIRG